MKTTLEPPATMSPSKLGEFRKCPRSFQFAAIDRVRTTPAAAAVRGSTVHRALELLYAEHPRHRVRSVLDQHVDTALTQVPFDEYTDRGQDVSDRNLAMVEEFLALQAESVYDLAHRIFEVEDPQLVDVVATETKLEMPWGDAVMRGILDRIDRADGGLVVVDYKTGKAPAERNESSRIAAMLIYARLVQHHYGGLPAVVRLVYLGDSPVRTIECVPSEPRMRGIDQQVKAVWASILTQCERGEFTARPGRLCGWCEYKPLCPAFA